MNMPRIAWDAKVTLGHVLVAVSIVGSVIVWVMSWGGKITMLEAQASQQVKTDERQDKEARERYETLRADIKEVGDRVNRVLEQRK